jgi:uncharacterized protein YndB with AHSA1/START domain
MRSQSIAALVVLLAGSSSTVQADESGAWEERGGRDGVTLASRDRAGSKIREIRAVAEVDAPPERVLAVLADIERYPQFMPPTEQAKLLRREGEAAVYYMEINPPVVARRDYCFKVEFDRLPDGTLRSHWQAETKGCLPERRGVVRVQATDGEWILEPREGGKKTHALYRCHIEVGGQVPAWMVNKGSINQLPDVINSLRRAVNQPRYASCTPTPSGCQ